MKFPSFAGSEEESRCLSFSGRSVRSTSFKVQVAGAEEA